MISETVVDLSSWQFSIIAISHLLLLPLTLSLSALLAVLETLYVWRGNLIYKTACQFWSRIFAVVFVLGVATRLGLLFQFGMNASYFSNYGGDVFALPLAIEALTSAFMASALFGPYLFGWERFSKGQHLLIIWIIAIAIKFSAVWLVVAESWLQNPVGSEFNFQSLRMELTDFSLVVTNPLVFNKIYHTLAAGYAVGAASILAVCSWLLLKNPADQAARKSYQLSAILGVLAILIICSGDNTLKSGNPVQIRKFAAVNALDSSNMLTGIELQISNGIKAYELLQELRDEKNDPQLLSDFNGLKADLGYALLLERWTNHITDANYTQIELAKKFTLPPHHALLFLFNRLMIVVGIINLLLFGLAVWQGFSKTPPQSWLLKLNMQLLLLPWLAFVGGWFIAIVGIQPWAMAEILPVFLSLSTLSVKELLISLPVYLICYAGLLLLALYLILHIINSQVSIRDTGVKT